jgi:hypothetical protein
MTTPIVIELPRILESVDRDTFLDGPGVAMTAATRPRFCERQRRAANRAIRGTTVSGERSLRPVSAASR